MDRRRYPFTIKLDDNGYAYFEVEQQGKIRFFYQKRKKNSKIHRKIRPEEIGSIIINYLRTMAKEFYNSHISEVVISVPAEFDQIQRNFTSKAVELTKMGVRRIISEPTAAALAYGLHQKKGVEYIVVVDVGEFFGLF